MSYRSNNFSLNLPKLKLDTSRHNFLYNSSLIWNELIGKILEKSDPNPNNIMIPGSSPNSDLSASISLVKKRLKKYLLGLQEVDVPTRPNEWLPLNFCKFSLNDQSSSWNSRLQEKSHIPRIKSNQIKIIFSTSTKTFTIPGWLGKYISCNMNIFEYQILSLGIRLNQVLYKSHLHQAGLKIQKLHKFFTNVWIFDNALVK